MLYPLGASTIFVYRPRRGAEIIKQHDTPAGLAAGIQDQSFPPEVNQLGRAVARWYTQIAARRPLPVSTDPPKRSTISPERIKRIGFGFRNFTNYRIRALLYAGKPNWDLLTSVTPPEIRRAGLPAAATTIRISETASSSRGLNHPPRHLRTPPRRSRTRKSCAPPPATPGPAPASSTSTGSAARTRRPCSGAGARPAEIPIMTAAHSGTPAAVFVCQHTHSTADL